MTRNKDAGKRRKKKTADGIEILRRRYVSNDPQMTRMVEEARANMEAARKIYDLRTQAGLSQRGLGGLIGTTASVICRLEDADYAGHSLGMLRRIAAALNRRVEIRFVPLREQRGRPRS